MMDKKKAADLLDNLVGMVEDSHEADYDTALRMGVEALSAQPDHSGDVNGKVDLIDRQAAIDAFNSTNELIIGGEANAQNVVNYINKVVGKIKDLPSAQPFHNTTLSEVLAYIDGMPEDVWQEFTACLECRGWYLVRRGAKWCGGDFA